MAITIRFPAVVALDGQAGGASTAVPAGAVIRRNVEPGNAFTYDVLASIGPDVGLALLGQIDFAELMSRAEIGQQADEWMILRLRAIDRDATAAACDFDIGSLYTIAVGEVPVGLSTGPIALGPAATAASARDNLALYTGDRLLLSEGAAGGPWDISVTVAAIPAQTAQNPTAAISGRTPAS